MVPYRDLFDHKTPGVYMLHALAIRLFGEHQWSIRAFELAAVVAAGFVIAWLSAPCDGRPAKGAVGRATALLTLLYFGVLNFWDTAQTELPYALLGCTAVLCARRFDGKGLVLPGLAGVAMGAAIVMKPPAVWLCAFAVGVMILRLRQQRARAWDCAKTCAATTAGVLLPLGSTLGYFAAKGALAPMADILIGANGYYVAHEREATPVAEIVDRAQGYFAHLMPLSLIVLTSAIVFAVAKKAGERERAAQYGFGLLLLGAAYLGVLMQMKFYVLHWTPLMLPTSLLGLRLADEFAQWLSRKGYSLRQAAMAPWLLLFAIYFTSPHGRRWVEQQLAVLRYARGLDTQERYLSRYTVDSQSFAYAESTWVGDWVREHTSQEEPVLIRDFQPEIYAIANRRYAGRFFWSTFLVKKERAYRRPEYLAEDDEAFRRAKPRIVVCRTDGERNTVDDPAYYTARGYRQVLVHGHFVILERTA